MIKKINLKRTFTLSLVLLFSITQTVTANETNNPPGKSIVWFWDGDNDGFGDDSKTIEAPSRPTGYVEKGGDCNDENPIINPGQNEVCNGLDDNCDGLIDEGVVPIWYQDLDNDFYSDGTTIEQCTEPGGYKLAGNLLSMAIDCDDDNPAVYPGASEICNERDDNCNGLIDDGISVVWYPDFDNDGYSIGQGIENCLRPGGHKLASELTSTSGDCDDNDPDVNAGATEACNGKDDDCDTQIDEGVLNVWFPDLDGDGYSNGLTIEQCVRPSGHKLASELTSTSGDCDDNDPDVNAGATEACNGKDDDCDTQIDEGVLNVWYPDLDGDSYSNGQTLEQCVRPSGYKLASELTSTSGDCDDNDPDVNAGAIEACNGKDDDCDTQIDEGVLNVWFPDLDGDGYSNGLTTEQCVRPSGYKLASELTSTNGDCDDNDPDVNAGVTEVCNGKDDDCDTQIDEEGVIPTWYADIDGDGYSDGSTIEQCQRPVGHKLPSELTSITGDCDDSNPSINAGATEICNNVDDNCNAQIDEGLFQTWYKDEDDDDYSDDTFVSACARPSGYKLPQELQGYNDCDDDNPAINPGAPEVCNQLDDNCNGQINEGITQTWYKDQDDDDYSDGTTVLDCQQPGGYKLLYQLAGADIDCDDDNPAINPGEPEVCNSIDDNCNGQINEGITQTWYKDQDDDDYSDGTTVLDCQQPGGYKLLYQLAGADIDCDDDNPAINPGAPEICNNIDDNCNGQLNEGLIRTWYKDIDNDGYSDGQNVTQCNQLGGYQLPENLIQISGDCNDQNPSIHPNAIEICDGLDNNCSGLADNSDPLLVDNEVPVASCNSIIVELDVNGEIEVAVEEIFDQPGSYDNCGQVIPVSLSKSLFTCADIGLNFPTLFVNDGHGNNAQCTGYVRVKDTMKPAVTCKTATVALNYFGEVETPPTVVFESGYDNCNNFYLSVVPNQFTCAELGDNFVTLYSVDDHDNENFCHSTITIIDDIAPDIYCKTHTVYLNEDGEGTMVPSDVYLDSYDNCGTVNLVSVSPNTFDCGDLTNLGAENIVQLTVNDGNGNSSSCTTPITVVDAISPIPNCQPRTYTLDASGVFNIPPADLFAGGWDNCNVLNPQSVDPPSLNCDKHGVNPVTLTVNDGNGNIGTCETTVTIDAGPYFTWHKDFDGDDWSDGTSVLYQCVQPIGYDLAMNLISLSGDCNDLDPFINPDRAELCNSVDDDCDALIDELLVTDIMVTNMSTCDDHGTSDPADDTFTADVTIVFDDIPSVGTLNLSGDGSASVPVANVAGTSHTFTGVEMAADGTPVSLSAVFTVATNCIFTETDLGFAPASCSPCDVLTIGVSNMGNCNPHGNSDPSDDTFTADVTVTFFNPPSFGTLDLSGDGTASVNVVELIGNSHTFTGVELLADGAPINLTAGFSANGSCSMNNQSAGVAMASCCNVAIASMTTTAESCEGAGDGTLEINAAGTGTLQYSIDGGVNFSFSNLFTNLLPGEINVTVQVQAQGCTDAATENIAAGSPLQTWYKDLDGDGYTDGMTLQSCSQPAGYVTNASPGDCDDNDALQHPGQVWYEDLDGDYYGTGNPLTACLRPFGCYTASELSGTAGDCDDDDPSINPSSPEVCNGIDDNCNGQIDEGTNGGMTWTGNVSMNNQVDVDNWASCYSIIQGNLTIQNGGVTSLVNLANLTEITGNVYIYATSLADLSGLENLTTVGGYLRIRMNNSMNTLDGIENVTSVGGYLKVYFNNSLTNCCAIHDLLTNGGVGGSITIMRNDSGCDNQTQIANTCAGNNPLIAPSSGSSAVIASETNDVYSDEAETTIEMENSSEVNFGNKMQAVERLTISPNPTQGIIQVSFHELTAPGLLHITDMSGRLLLEKSIEQNTSSLQFDLSQYSTGIYLLILKIEGKETQARQIVLKKD